MAVIAIDFDGTLVDDNYPEIGEIKAGAIQFLKNLEADGHQLILYTCREDELLEQATDYLRLKGFEFRYINENIPERVLEYGSDPRKIGYDLLIDDRTLNFNPDFDTMYGQIQEYFKPKPAKKIILVGRTCTGKTHLKNKLMKQGYIPEVSYCTRELRDGEVDGFDYHKLSKEAFEGFIKKGFFVEYDKFGGEYYGASKAEFERCNLFIMTPNGVKQLTPEQRAKCHVILMKCSYETAIKRMKERGWDFDKIMSRQYHDSLAFYNFTDYDEIINTD